MPSEAIVGAKRSTIHFTNNVTDTNNQCHTKEYLGERSFSYPMDQRIQLIKAPTLTLYHIRGFSPKRQKKLVAAMFEHLKGRFRSLGEH